MQAAQLYKYDKNFKLKINEIPTPTPMANEVLVRVKFAAVNPLEQLIGTGKVRLMQDYALPTTMGNELSGIITAVGANVTDFRVGEAVYSRLPLNKIGAFAEFVAIDQQAVALKPQNLDFAHSAAVPLTGLTAYQGLQEELHVQPGERLLIPGGSGSFGQMSIPIAREMGLHVSVSGNVRSKAAVLASGATQYFDYRQENYWEKSAPVDAVIDTLGSKELSHELQIIKPGGKLLSLIMGPNRQFAQSHHLSWTKTALFSLAGARLDRQAKRVGAQYRFIFVRSDGAQLRKITQLVEREGIVPAVDPTEFRLADINQALSLVATGHPQGKVLIRL